MSATAGTKLGIKAVAYYNSGTVASPTWTAMPSILDVDMGADWETAEAGARITRAKLYGKTQIDLPQSLNFKADDVQADYQAMIAQAFTDLPVGLLILDGPLTEVNAFGFFIPALVCGTPQDQGAGNVIYVKMPIKCGALFNNTGVLQPPGYVFTANNAATIVSL